MRFLYILSLSLLSLVSISQEDPLDFYGDVMTNAVEGAHRSYAADLFYKELIDKLNEPNSFSDPMADIEWISKLYAADSTFRVLTYQVKINDNTYESVGFVQRRNGVVIPLINKSSELEDLEYLSLDQDNWLGVLYYNMMEVEIDGKTNYLLFGYDGHSKYDRRKVLEVITEVNDKEVLFGNEIFIIEKEGERPDKKQRILIEYSGDSNVTFNYDDGLDMIVHDHLITRMGLLPGQGATQVSDGSLVGYQFKDDGMWHYVEKIFDYISEEAPRPVPVFDGKKKDTNIMGNEVKKKKKRPK